MPIENNIPNFNHLFGQYQKIYSDLEKFILEQKELENLQWLNKILEEFNYCDVKLRMAFAIDDIRLNQEFMKRKVGDLKLCHLMLYKFADLWFSYETFFDLYEQVNSQSIQSKIVWMSHKKYSDYKNINEISEALIRANQQINLKFETEEKRNDLIQYLNYCEAESYKSQKKRINKIISRLSPHVRIPDLNESEFLTIGYSIRNNFVHNGETTVTTPELSYSNKKDLLIVLYEFISILNLAITNKLMRDFCT